MKRRAKLFIPGPVEVSPRTLRAFATPPIGHRGREFMELYGRVQPRLQKLFHTRRPVFVSTSSAWGVMEAAIRNLVSQKVLCCCCGAFSDKWFDVAQACGKQAEKLQVDWGEPIPPEVVEAKLHRGGFDALTLVHNETSTGLMNPLEEIATVMRKFPDVMFIVDAVSSLGGVRIETDRLGLDVLLTGSQKALALPPGVALFTVSERAMKKAAGVGGRGYYFDFWEFQKNHEKNQTPSTPSIGHFYALESKLKEIFEEGLSARYARHRNMAEMTRAWARRHGWEMFPRTGCESVTLSCIRNNRGMDLARLKETLRRRHGALVDIGYGPLKGKTFRIAHMGDETPRTIGWLLRAMEQCW